jgi:hypothetical protein
MYRAERGDFDRIVCAGQGAPLNLTVPEGLGDPAFAQDPARQFLQVLARAILRPVQEVVTLIGGQLRFE